MKQLQSRKILKKKWAIDVLMYLCKNKRTSYGTIRDTLHIPNATLAVLLGDFVKCGILDKFIIGKDWQFHYTEYLLPSNRLVCINKLFQD